MDITLAYGKEGLSARLPDQTEVISARFVPGIPDEAGAILAALREPLGSAALKE